ncbi:MAG TPA: response regulator [Ktedonobacterales bacterium]|jgi:CheY-like chemotaxis protein
MDISPLTLLPPDGAWVPGTHHEPGASVFGGDHRPVVMIVDDDDGIANLLADLLTDEGYRVVVARDGLAALRGVRRERPAMVLTDCMMPGLDGVEFLRELRRHPSTRTIPVVLMSSSRPRNPALADVPFLAKPFDVDDVLEIVARYAFAPSLSPLYGEG